MIKLGLLRGVCQLPAYTAYEKGFFREQGLDVQIEIAPTAWTIPDRLVGGDVSFAVIPWTRGAAACAEGVPLRVICGSGFEEAALVVRTGLELDQVSRIAIPQRGGMKDLTAMGLIRSLGLTDLELIRLPSGDGAILSLVGEGADAASMVEPWAAMMEMQGVGRVVKRTGDVWKCAPGCSLTTSAEVIERSPELVLKVVKAYVKGDALVEEDPSEAARIGADYIGVNAKFIENALQSNRPSVNALQDPQPRNEILQLMKEMGYIDRIPEDYCELSFLEEARTTE